jgi:hypothetical protein
MNKKNLLLSLAGLLATGLTMSSCTMIDHPVTTAADDTYTATIDGASEKPVSTTSTAVGSFVGRLNEASRTLSYTVTYSGFTPTAGHLHKVVNPDGTGPVVFPLPNLTSPIIGSATFTTQAQMDSLKRGLFYVNLHSARFPGGEIRGDIKN